MKRLLVLTAVLAITLLAFALTVVAQPVAPSVPNLIDFQGKLTTPAGNPVADGPHTFVFRIYDAAAGGTLLWSEGPLGISTTGGLFTHQLGSSNPLPENLFIDNNPHYLEVEADGAIINPRTQLISHPFSRTANALEAKNSASGVTMVRTEDGNHGLSTYGGDGQEQIRLWGPSWGEILLFDDDPTNDLTAVLTSNDFPGGALYLRNDVGVTTLTLSGGTPGNGAAVLPVDAISAVEMLDEPGIAHAHGARAIPLAAADSVLDSVTITAPTAGYVVVTATALIDYSHVSGTKDLGRVSISKGTVLDFIYLSLWSVGAVEASGEVDRNCVVQRVEAVSAGTNKYRLVADQFLGTGQIVRYQLTAAFFPTIYGTVTLAAAAPPGQEFVPDPSRADGGLSAAGLDAQKQVITVEQHQATVAAEQAKQMAELEARIKKLEEAAKQGKQQAVDENR